MSNPDPRLRADHGEINELKARVDLAEVIRQSGVALQKTGNNLLGKCPFHKDGQASLSVNEERQLFNCFGCQTGGDVLTFLQLKEGLTFPQALERLRAYAGEPSTQRRGGGNGTARPAKPPADVDAPLPGGHSRSGLLGRVADLYAQRLRESRPAQEYLASRGLGSSEVWEAFGIGVADGSLMATLPESGDLREALIQIGVLTARGREHFGGYLVVPLSHPDHGVLGLYGRNLRPDAKVPHLYLPGPRRGVLNWQALKLSSAVLVAESILDAISLWAAGCRDVTCLFGVQGLPADLEEMLGRFGVREVHFCLDADRAGREATTRLAESLGRRGIRCQQVVLPEGKDPNLVLVESGAAELQRLVHAHEPMPGAQEAGGQEEPVEAGGPVREATGDGFLLHFGEVVYRVTPLAPFGDRLRVKIDARRLERTHVDKLDLFSHRARSTAIAQLSRALELARDLVERHFLVLLEESERWAADILHAAETDADAFKVVEPPELTAAEREEALAFLRRPNLTHAVLDDMERLGYVGEERAKLMAYLIGVSRKLDRPLSGIVLSQSGAGKSTLTDAVENLTPAEDVVLFSRLSAQALGYMPRDYLKHKLLILEERVGGEAADYSIRVLQSRQKYCQAVVMKDQNTGRMHTRRVEVEGPIAYMETTTDAAVNHENATRCFELGLDESEEQTRRIQARQRHSRTLRGAEQKELADEVRRRHHNAQRLLEPVRVVIPYVEMLSFPSRWLRTRRDNERFLCLVDAVAFLHQHQRKGGTHTVQDRSFRWVEATVDDYRLAYDLAQDVLGATLHELTRDSQDLWASIQDLVGETAAASERKATTVLFTRKGLRERTRWDDTRLRRALQELVEMEYLAAASGSQGRTYQYRVAFQEDAVTPAILGELTTPEQLEQMLAETGGER